MMLQTCAVRLADGIKPLRCVFLKPFRIALPINREPVAKQHFPCLFSIAII